jgi:hypothetical protein
MESSFSVSFLVFPNCRVEVDEIVLKAQIHAGYDHHQSMSSSRRLILLSGRGKGVFKKSGLKGGVLLTRR